MSEKTAIGNVLVARNGYERTIVGLAETTCLLRQIGGEKPKTGTARPAN